MNLLRIRLALIPGAILLILAGCQTSGRLSQEERAVEEISFFQGQEDADEAVRRMEKVEKDYREKGEALPEELQELYAGLLLTAGNYEAALDRAQALLEANPEDVEALITKAAVLLGKGKMEEARIPAEKAASLAPENGEVQVVNGRIALAREEYSAAEEWFSKALEGDSENLVALLGKAAVLQERGDKKQDEQALKLLSRAEEIAPGFAYIYADKAAIERKYGWVNRALEDLNRAVELEPGNPWHYLDRSRLYLTSRNEPGMAEEDFRRVTELKPENPLAWSYLGDIYRNRGALGQAGAAYRKVLDLEPGFERVYAPYGQVLFLQERWEEAHGMFDRAWERSRGVHSYALMAALCLHRKGDPKKAANYINGKRSRIPRDSLLYEAARYMVSGGSDYYLQSAIDEASDWRLRQRGLFYLGEMYLVKGRERAALSTFQTIESGTNRAVRSGDSALDQYLKQFDTPPSGGNEMEVELALAELEKLRKGENNNE